MILFAIKNYRCADISYVEWNLGCERHAGGRVSRCGRPRKGVIVDFCMGMQSTPPPYSGILRIFLCKYDLKWRALFLCPCTATIILPTYKLHVYPFLHGVEEHVYVLGLARGSRR